jgi:hypothetical protein
MGAIAANTAFSASLSSLTTTGVPANLPAITPNTTYYFAAWSNVGGIWYPGQVLSFKTASTTIGGGGHNGNGNESEGIENESGGGNNGGENENENIVTPPVTPPVTGGQNDGSGSGSHGNGDNHQNNSGGKNHDN